MSIRYATSPHEYKSFSTRELRERFLVDSLFPVDAVQTLYWENDRAVVGSAVPTGDPLALETRPELASGFFCERRELGVMNLGGPGTVRVEGEDFRLSRLDMLYVGRGSREVVFSSDDAGDPARFYLVSYPAHREYPTVLIPQKGAREVHLGSKAEANERTIYQYIHEEGAQSCQLVMGFTHLEEGSVWNTMPAHTHWRRSEVYLYFDVPEDHAVFHFMGPADETRHLVLQNEQAVLSPAWSIHSGSGTRNYSFIWAMGGENQRFTDMDGIPISTIR